MSYETSTSSARFQHTAHSASSRCDSVPPGMRLLTASVVLRHGDRAPIDNVLMKGADSERLAEAFWATRVLSDAHIATLSSRFPLACLGSGTSRRPSPVATRWPYGALTARGAEQSFLIGRHLRALYGPTLCAPSNVVARSTAVARTVNTARSFLAGFCSSLGTTWDDEELQLDDAAQAAARPLRILVETDPASALVANFSYAQRSVPVLIQDYHAANAAMQASESMTRVKATLLSALPRLRDTWSRSSLLFAFDSLKCRHAHARGDIAPGAFEEDALYAELGDAIAGVFWDAYCAPHGTTTSGAMVAAAMVEDIADGFARGAAAPIRVYVGHDTTLMPTLAALGLSEEANGKQRSWPPYASHIRIELLERESREREQVVRVVYNGNVVSLPSCGGRELCTLAEFNALVKELRPRGWQRLAQGSSDRAC